MSEQEIGSREGYGQLGLVGEEKLECSGGTVAQEALGTRDSLGRL